MKLKGKFGKVLLCSGVALITSIGVLAQSHPMASTGPSNGAGVPNYGGQNPSDPGVDPAARDRAFVKKTLENGAAEVKLGELAQQNSQSDGVKQFAQKMVEDHKQFDGKIEPIATQLGVAAPKDFSRKDKKLVAKLEGLTGPAFDKEFLSAVLKDHQDDLKDFNSEANTTQNAALKEAAQDGATALTQHLQAIQAISQSHSGTASH